jgi:hypothetical protein
MVIPGSSYGSTTFYGCGWGYSGGGSGSVRWSDNTSTASGQRLIRSFPLSGIESITSENSMITLKITPTAELNAIGPTTVLALPENSTGNYDVILDSSTDLVT